MHDPARVTFRTATFLDAPQYGIRHDAAYWVSRIRPRADGVLRRHRPHVVGLRGAGRNRDRRRHTRDRPGALRRGRAGRRDHRGPAVARLEGTLANVRQLRVDVRRTCLTGAFAYAIHSDGPATLTLSDGRVLALVAGDNTGTLPAR